MGNKATIFANNGHGAGLWLSAIYKNLDSEGFTSQGPSYGVDMNMFSLALGGDLTKATDISMKEVVSLV